MSTRERWLVTGAAGQLGSHVVRQLAGPASGCALLALTRQPDVGTAGIEVRRIDLSQAEMVSACVAQFKPTHILHLGAMTAVSDCHARPDDAYAINTAATRVLAEAARNCGARLVFSSTDMVFDGQAAPYCESDPPQPLSHYGRTKVAAEHVLADFDRVLTVRLPLMYGSPCSSRETTFVKQMAALRAGQPLRLFTDEFRTPIWLADAARAVIGLARSDLCGLIHVAGPDPLSRYGLIAQCAKLLGIAEPNLIPSSRLSVASPEPRPADLSLDARRFVGLFPHLAPGPVRAAAFADA